MEIDSICHLRKLVILHNNITVSYTHLDVYKRQILSTNVPTNRPSAGQTFCLGPSLQRPKTVVPA